MPEDHGQRLATFAQRLEAAGFPTRLLPAGEQTPGDTLFVAIQNDAPEANSRLELSFVPGMSEQLEGCEILQLLAPLPVEVGLDQQAEIERLLGRLNTRLPIVGFVLLEEASRICFRHCAVLGKEAGASAESVVQTVWMTAYLLQVFAPVLGKVATGDTTAAHALAEPPIGQIFAS